MPQLTDHQAQEPVQVAVQVAVEKVAVQEAVDRVVVEEAVDEVAAIEEAVEEAALIDEAAAIAFSNAICVAKCSECNNSCSCCFNCKEARSASFPLLSSLY